VYSVEPLEPPARHRVSRSINNPEEEKMDTLRSIQSLNADPAAPGNPRWSAASHIHGVLNQQGPPQQVTVGHAVAAAIEGIRSIAGENGARRVDTVFTDRSLDNAYKTPLNSPNAHAAHEQIATAELRYWQQEAAQSPSAATDAALRFGVQQRVQMQTRLGQLVQVGQSFTDYLQQQQTSSTGQNPYAATANNYLPSGTVQSSTSSNSYAQQAPKPASPKKSR
jgi:hypothetical protein